MSRVFTLEEILQRRIPSLESFEKVGTMLRKRLISSTSVTGALLVGSFLRGDHWVGSDIDVVVVYDSDKRTDAMRLFQRLRKEANELYIPLEFITLDTDLAATKHHHIAATFLGHFRLCSRFGGVIKKNPADIIFQNRDTFIFDTYSYIVHKLRVFEKGQASLGSLPDEQYARLLEKALSFPTYLARKMLRVIEHEFSGDDSNAEVSRLYPELIPEASKAFLKVRDMNVLYRDIIRSQSQCPNGPEYERTLKYLEEAVLIAYEFARENLGYLVCRFSL